MSENVTLKIGHVPPEVRQQESRDLLASYRTNDNFTLELVAMSREIPGMRVLFTKENASEMAKRSHAPGSARHLKKPDHPDFNSDSQMSQSNGSTADEQRKGVLRQQIEILDYHIARTKRAGNLCKLISAKARLWELLYPKPGSLRPGKQRGNGHESRGPVEPIHEHQAPQPVDNVPALVATSTDENHNAKSAHQNHQ